MRHIRGVYVRNVDMHVLADTCFRILIDEREIQSWEANDDISSQSSSGSGGSRGGEGDVCLYESHVYEHSLNPMWTFDEGEFITAHTKKGTTNAANTAVMSSIVSDDGDEGEDAKSGDGVAASAAALDGGGRMTTATMMKRQINRCAGMTVELMYVVDRRHVSKNKAICRTKFNFRDVVYIGSSIDRLVHDTLPFNCIIIEFVDGMFLAQETFALMGKPLSNEHDVITRFASLQPTDTPPVEIELKTVEQEITKLIDLRDQINIAEERSQSQRVEIEKILQRRSNAVQLQQDLENARSRIKRLRQKIDIKTAHISKAEESLMEKRETLKRDQAAFDEAQEQLLVEKKRLAQQQQNDLPQQQAQLSVLNAKCSQRQCTIVRQIQDIFVIEMHHSGQYYIINNLAIMKGDQIGTNDETASALGYVAQCVKMISSLYQITLKFQVFPLASRSFVREDIGDQKNLLPLYLPKASERSKYFRAVMLLNSNILHIMQVRNVAVKAKNPNDALENLLFLFKALGNA